MNRIAIIDIGTNTTRVILFDTARGPLDVVFEDDRVTRLGKGIAGKRLLPESIERTLKIVAEYRDRAAAAGAERIIAVGTSAVRDAENRDEFIARLAEMGVEPRALSGNEEAALVFRGVAAGMREKTDGALVVIDVGGGSTELIAGRGGSLLAAVSVNEGAVRLTERFISRDPPGADELERMKRHVDARIAEALETISAPRGARVIAVAGTAVTLAMVAMKTPVFEPEIIHSYNIDKAKVEDIFDFFAAATTEQRRETVGMEPGREDVIAAGAYLFVSTLRALDATGMEVSNFDLRHGLLMEVIEKQ